MNAHWAWAALRTQGAERDRWHILAMCPCIPTLFTFLPTSKWKLTEQICWVNGSRKMPLPSSRTWSSLAGQHPLPLVPRDRLCPTEQVNELVASTPQWPELCTQRTTQHVLLSVLLSLLAFGLVVFFLFPNSVLVDDGGIRVRKVTFSKQDSHFSVAIASLSSKFSVWTQWWSYLTANVSLTPPWSEQWVSVTVQAGAAVFPCVLLHVAQCPGVQRSDLPENFR